MTVLQSILWFLVAIGILVSFHEFGHFWVARKMGVKVLRFSVGFGKVLWSRTGKDGCEYALSAIPLGGYVKMLDEREGEVAPEEAHMSFNRAAAWKRLLIVAAGPFANFALAILFFWMVFVIGQPGMKPLLDTPPAASIAARAGLQGGELITQVNGEPVSTFSQLRGHLLEQAVDRGPMRLTVQRSLEDTTSRSVALDLSRVRIDPEHLFDDLGVNPYQPKFKPVIESVEPGYSAEQAGFKAGDVLLARDGEAIDDWTDWAQWVREHPGSAPKVQLQRGDQTLTLQPVISTIGEGEERVGRFGARVAVPKEAFAGLEAEERLSPLAAIPAAFAETWRMSTLTLKMFGRMFTGEVSLKNVSGPIQIAEAAGFTARVGIAAYLSFLGLVSVSLAVLNLLPVPVLDGGHIVFYTYEMIRGAPVPEKVVAFGQRFGLLLLMMLMGLAFYNDLSRVFSAF